MSSKQAAEKCPLVFIQWEDSAQPVPGWRFLSDFDEPKIVRCASVGWLIHNGDDVKALAPNMGEDGTESSAAVCGVIRIPTRCIIQVVRLKEPRLK
jgi:hypothetical protein